MTVRIALKGLAARAGAQNESSKVGMLFTHVNKGGTAEECLSSLESSGGADSGRRLRGFYSTPKTRERRVFPWQRCKTTRWISSSPCVQGPRLVFPGSEIYGGLANTWDYGPLGVEFKNNVKRVVEEVRSREQVQRRHRLRDSDEPVRFGWLAATWATSTIR